MLKISVLYVCMFNHYVTNTMEGTESIGEVSKKRLVLKLKRALVHAEPFI